MLMLDISVVKLTELPLDANKNILLLYMLNKIILSLLVIILVMYIYNRIDNFLVDEPKCSRPFQYLPSGIRCVSPGKGYQVETFCSERHKELKLC